MTEVVLKLNGKSVFEFETVSVPRNGEILDISHDEISGVFTIVKVKHRILQDGKTKKVYSYVEVEAEGVSDRKINFNLSEHLNQHIAQ